MVYMKSLVFICFFLLGQAAHGAEEVRSETHFFTEVISLYESEYLKKLYQKKSAIELEQEYEILQMGLHIVEFLRNSLAFSHLRYKRIYLQM